MCGTRVVIFFVCALVARVVCEDFNLLILHNNDMHARFEETELNSATCRPANRNRTCIGGFARTAHEIRRHRRQAQEGTGPPVIYLNAGDTFTGTVWYSVFTHNITAEMVNLLAPDAMTLGNHEFDNGVEVLEKYLTKIKSPVVVSNIDFKDVPILQNKTVKSHILTVSGRKIGIVGYITTGTPESSNSSKSIFYDEIDSLKQETLKLKNNNVTIIIAIGHSGHAMDKKVAENVEEIDLIIGGHSHSLLWNGSPPSIESITDSYPTIATQKSGKRVPIVQVYAFTKYLGKLHVTFDDYGNLISFLGFPILLNSSITQDRDVLNALDKYRPRVNEIFNDIVGETLVVLDGNRFNCWYKECNFGDLIADAFVTYLAAKSSTIWTDTPIGLMHAGGIRDTIDPFEISSQNISRGQLETCLPFGDDVVSLNLKGIDLKNALEHGISSGGGAEFLQLSGIRVFYDKSRPPGSRVISLKVRCGNCSVPTYQPIDLNATYRVVTTSFTADGGDGHTTIKHDGFNRTVDGLKDVDVISWYLQNYSPVYPSVEGRIQFVEHKKGPNSARLYESSVFVLLSSIMLLLCMN